MPAKHLSTHPAYAEALRLHAEATTRLRAAEDGLRAVESMRLPAEDRPAGAAEMAAALLSVNGPDLDRAHLAQVEDVGRLRRAQQAAAQAMEDAQREFAQVVRADELPAWNQRAAAVRSLLAETLAALKAHNAADLAAHQRITRERGVCADDSIRSLAIETDHLGRLVADLDELIAEHQPRRAAAAA